MDVRAPQVANAGGKRGGWITFSFIIGAALGLTLATGGWGANLIVYLIQEFHVKSINAAQISNIVSGCSNLFPVVGAVVADSFFGPFSVVSISACISLLGLVLLTLTATLDALRPQPCANGSSFCTPPSGVQYAVLYTALALACIGSGGSGFTLATMGANQFDKPKDQGIFFNWYFFTVYFASAVSSTAIVYIEDNVSWKVGYGVILLVNFISLAVFLLGNRFYLRDKPQGSPFTGLVRVVVAAARKRRAQLSSKIEDYYHGQEDKMADIATTPKRSFRFLNRAALKTEGDVQSDGSIARPWKICTVQQVEDFKTLIRIFPLWSSSIFLGITIGVQGNFTVLQALTMDRHLGPHFQIPAGSIGVVGLISICTFLALIDRFLCPMWQKLTHSYPTPLQRIGMGHVLNILGMAITALVEAKRLKVARAHHLQGRPGSVVPMSCLWLFPQVVVVGLADAFHFPAQVALYYQEFPVSLRSTSTAMIALIVGISFYLGTALIDLVRRIIRWLPDNINDGRLDNLYWMLVVGCVVNFVYYLVCSCLYKYQSVENGADDNSITEK